MESSLKKLSLVAATWLGLFALVACGPAQDFVSKPQEVQKTEFQKLVEERDFEGALDLVCKNKSYKLKCNKISLDIRDEDYSTGNYAITDKFGYITVYESAFSFMGNASEGWLAAIIGHEMVHVKQGYFALTGAYVKSLWGDMSAHAALEVEGWGHMKDLKERYGLSCSMILTIETNLISYEYAKEHGVFDDESSDPVLNKQNDERLNKVYRQCLSKP